MKQRISSIQNDNVRQPNKGRKKKNWLTPTPIFLKNKITIKINFSFRVIIFGNCSINSFTI